MTESLVNFFINSFGGLTSLAFGKELLIFIISLFPILELRGGLIAAALLDVEPVISFIICYIGNLVPIPFILLFITPLFKKLKKTKLLSGLVTKIENKANNKKDQIEKYKYWGLLIFVGIPLPGTGAWTGALIACMLEMDKKKSFFTIMAGVLLAGIIMMILSFGILKGIIG